ncbi:sigma-70 family RNA polymerase sigma factor [Arenibacter echinorum]|uniref:RNA polymerase sigma (SigZ) subunit n=1 Tax=Arenibacter echinorum TaxID=440515 RepID=A0A327R5W5_9FLAO|nr:sigma-70 family RNA polymerase sigma factor [Arenibacter echinorum]RAJ04781.1 RNA polymerase sigma-70 factor (ECF subfamily) [Arenibacter echinorum]RAJ04793.1 RNA polymerase sigma-70 factor (ECF subfamily) [Arenibacter echinorum]RAJ04806.1 RNA polymerase sigma (SigZ) subunit [Arenibacter echinorum]RAJ12229.1 RNA polymerase sigma-70 factor (ECF subfamily) [Arenibacter echinorum]
MKTEINTIWIDLNEELYKFILEKIKDEQTSKDIHQEVFLKIQTKIHQLKHTSKLTSWVYQITRNSIVDYFKKVKNSNISINDLDIPEIDTNNFDYSNLTNCINQKIENLSSQHKEAIILTSFKNYSQKELAEHLKISYSGTKSRVQKAKEILKENILDCPNVESDSTGKLIDFENN